MKIGLALSGGGAKGIAHIGALQAMDERGIKPAIISGVSAGAIVGTLYASGLPPKEILKIFTSTNVARYVRLAWSKFGFFRIERLASIYHIHLPFKTFEELHIPVIISAADIREGKTVYFREGELIMPILASSCIPILFAPVHYNGNQLVDGGIINNLPVEPLIGECQLIIGVHVNPFNRNYRISSIKSVVERTFQLAIIHNVMERIRYCHLFIEPPELTAYNIFDIAKAKEIYEYGYRQACKVLDESEEMLEPYKKSL